MSAFAFSQGASAQSAATQASPPAQSPTSATAQPRPDANYAKPSGQGQPTEQEADAAEEIDDDRFEQRNCRESRGS